MTLFHGNDFDTKVRHSRKNPHESIVKGLDFALIEWMNLLRAGRNVTPRVTI